MPCPGGIRTWDPLGTIYKDLNLMSKLKNNNFTEIYFNQTLKYLIVRTFFDKKYLYKSNICIVCKKTMQKMLKTLLVRLAGKYINKASKIN